MGDIDDKKLGRITGRISSELRNRLDDISKNYGPNDALMLKDALTALADYVEANGGYFRPVKMVRAKNRTTARPVVYGVNEADDSLLSRLQALLESEAARRRRDLENSPRE